MDAVLESCAGLDVHQETVVACVLYGSLDKKPKKEIRTFPTTTQGLLDLGDWLEDKECTDVALESTGVYWKPVWNLLEGYSFKLLLANAYHIKQVPGRKSDVKDAEWIAKLLRSGLLHPSFVPSAPFRDLRDLTRYRKKLLRDASAEKNRIHNILQDANIKITTYITDIFGTSGTAILEALMNGEKITTEWLDQHVKGRLRSKIHLLMDPLNGKLRKHHRTMMRFAWDHLNYIKETITQVEQEIEQCLQPYQNEKDLLVTIPGISHHSVSVILAELGNDMSVFPTARHLASWAGLAPGNYESAGKRKNVGTTKGNKALKTLLCEAAWAASRSKNTRFSSRYWSLVKRMGPKKALIAVAHTLLRVIYKVLVSQKSYYELGAEYLKDRDAKWEKKLIHQLEQRGFRVEKIS